MTESTWPSGPGLNVPFDAVKTKEVPNCTLIGSGGSDGTNGCCKSSVADVFGYTFKYVVTSVLFW